MILNISYKQELGDKDGLAFFYVSPPFVTRGETQPSPRFLSNFSFSKTL